MRRASIVLLILVLAHAGLGVELFIDSMSIDSGLAVGEPAYFEGRFRYSGGSATTEVTAVLVESCGAFTLESPSSTTYAGPEASVTQQWKVIPTAAGTYSNCFTVQMATTRFPISEGPTSIEETATLTHTISASGGGGGGGSGPSCGDGTCDSGECASGCSLDCGWWQCNTDGVCSPDVDETCANSGDCSCQPGSTCNMANPQADSWGCVAPYCGDGSCGSGECSSGCTQDCKTWNCGGNGACDSAIGEDCSNSGDCRCPSGSKCNKWDSHADAMGCVAPYCGDGKCDPGECSSGCSNDCTTWNCRGNGQCDSAIGEDCYKTDDCKCSSSQVCDSSRPTADTKGCAQVSAGDGYCDSDKGESSEESCEDCGCPGWDKKVCDKSTHKCVECVKDGDCTSADEHTCHKARKMCVQCQTDEDCGGRKCDVATFRCTSCVVDDDCQGYTAWSGSYRCNADYTKVEETGTKQMGRCSDGECKFSSGGTEIRAHEACSGTFCQDGSCGCSEGYKECAGAVQCVRIGALQTNAACHCDFECESGYCKSGKCVQTAVVSFTSQRTQIDAGETTKATLTIKNTLDEEVTYALTLSSGTGTSIVGIVSGMSCTAGGCSSSGKLPPLGEEDIEIEITPEEAGELTLVATSDLVTADAGEVHLPRQTITIQATKCGDGMCSKEAGESSSTCCIDCGCPRGNVVMGYYCIENKCKPMIGGGGLAAIVIFGVLVLIVVLVAVFRRQIVDTLSRRKATHEQEKEKKRKDYAESAEKSRKERAKELEEEVLGIIKDGDRGRGISLRRIIRRTDMSESDARNALKSLVSSKKIKKKDNKYLK